MSGVAVQSPVKSPSLGENSKAFLVDENGYHIPVLAIVQPNAAGHSGLSAQVVADGDVSQVTARRNAPLVTLPSANGKAEVYALMSLDASGNLVPLNLSGKFQSAELTGTGSSQNVAHGLGVVPSLVLAAIQDTNGVALPIAIAEGAHDATNLKLTVTSGVKFKVIAFA